MRRRLSRLALAVSIGPALLSGGPAVAAPNAHGAPAAKLPIAQLSAGLYRIRAEVAATPADLQRGLMFRQELPDQNGMLFLFAQKTRQCMWMLNTLIPLSVAFLRDDGTIVNIENMAPQTETSHCSNEPVRVALEMNAGWFAKRGVGPGSSIKGLPALR